MGAASWYTRGLGFSDDSGLTAELALGLAEVARRLGTPDVALQRLDQARRAFAALENPAGIARVLLCQARIAAAADRTSEALGALQEALASLRDVPGRQPLEIEVRLEIGRIYLAAGWLPDVEHEVRRAEEEAITHNLSRELVRVYLLLGEVRRRQGDESGFVFFENAIALCRGLEPALDLEGEVYLAYGRFRETLGELEEARACLERGRDIRISLGDSAALAAVSSVPDETPP
jgi:tetratricopeptide (TPR) repeat protein